MPDRQVSASQAVRTIMESSGYLAISAVVFLLLAAMLPVATFSASLGGTEVDGLRSVGGGATAVTGASAAGVVGWLAVLLFIAAAASRFVRELAPFKRLFDIAALAFLAVAVVWSVTDGPMAVQMNTARQVSHMLDGFASASGGAPRTALPTIAVSLMPSIGSLFVILAPVALVMARRRESMAGPHQA